MAKFGRDRWHGPYPYEEEGITHLRSQMDAHLAGAYLVRLKGATILYPFCRSSIIYLGKAKDIDTRLLEHLRDSEPNDALRNYLTRRACTFQFGKWNMNGARSLEREYLMWCIKKLGSKPIYNNQL